METHILETTIRKDGYLELTNLPFHEGAVVRIAISTKGKKENLERLINNDHVSKRLSLTLSSLCITFAT
jgi:hypothetical protein